MVYDLISCFHHQCKHLLSSSSQLPLLVIGLVIYDAGWVWGVMFVQGSENVIFSCVQIAVDSSFGYCGSLDCCSCGYSGSVC